MAYDDYRAKLIEAYYINQLNEFFGGFDVKKPTVILLPGGMGSELTRTRGPFPQQPNLFNDTIWMDLSLLTGDAKKLQVQKNVRDLDSFVVAANGPV